MTSIISNDFRMADYNYTVLNSDYSLIKIVIRWGWLLVIAYARFWSDNTVICIPVRAMIKTHNVGLILSKYCIGPRMQRPMIS